MLGTKSLFAGLVLSVVASSGTTVAAQQPQACTDRNSAISHLASKYHEQPIAMGLAHNGGVIEVLAAETGKTWSIIVTMPSGITCMVATGEGWEKLPIETAEPGSGV